MSSYDQSSLVRSERCSFKSSAPAMIHMDSWCAQSASAWCLSGWYFFNNFLLALITLDLPIERLKKTWKNLPDSLSLVDFPLGFVQICANHRIQGTSVALNFLESWKKRRHSSRCFTRRQPSGELRIWKSSINLWFRSSGNWSMQVDSPSLGRWIPKHCCPWWIRKSIKLLYSWSPVSAGFIFAARR